MAYILGEVTLPQPKKLTRKIIEQSVEHLLMFGKTTKRTTNRKEQFVLSYVYLTQQQINAILSLYALEIPLQFQCTDENMPISATEVLMDVTGLEYPPSGELWRENVRVILTEVI